MEEQHSRIVYHLHTLSDSRTLKSIHWNLKNLQAHSSQKMKFKGYGGVAQTLILSYR